jgi:hypothetical protein
LSELVIFDDSIKRISVIGIAVNVTGETLSTIRITETYDVAFVGG